jgi:hypothetical protein
MWGAHAAQDPEGFSTGLKPVCQDRNAGSSVSFSTATRTVRNGWTVSQIPPHLLSLDHLGVRAPNVQKFTLRA